MTIKRFLEQLDFIRENKWFYFGNDLAANLQGDSLVPKLNLDEDVNSLKDEHFIHIGRVLKLGNVAKPHNELIYARTAKIQLQKELYFEKLVDEFQTLLGNDFTVYQSYGNVYVEVPEIGDFEIYNKKVRANKIKAMDKVGKIYPFTLIVYNKERESTATPLG